MEPMNAPRVPIGAQYPSLARFLAEGGLMTDLCTLKLLTLLDPEGGHVAAYAEGWAARHAPDSTEEAEGSYPLRGGDST